MRGRMDKWRAKRYKRRDNRGQMIQKRGQEREKEAKVGKRRQKNTISFKKIFYNQAGMVL